LKALMATYGGVYEHYYSKSKVTDKVPVWLYSGYPHYCHQSSWRKNSRFDQVRRS
jgi:hypothetical protein